MSDFQDNAPVQLKPMKACAQIIAERDQLRAALEFYAREEHWETNLGGDGIGAAHDDQGSRARAALGLPTDFRKLNG